MYLDLQQNQEVGDDMAMYYEVGIKISDAKSIITVDTNYIPAKDWKQAVDYVRRVSKNEYPDLNVEFEFVKEYNIEDEPTDIGYIHGTSGRWEI